MLLFREDLLSYWLYAQSVLGLCGASAPKQGCLGLPKRYPRVASTQKAVCQVFPCCRQCFKAMHPCSLVGQGSMLRPCYEGCTIQLDSIKAKSAQLLTSTTWHIDAFLFLIHKGQGQHQGRRLLSRALPSVLMSIPLMQPSTPQMHFATSS